MKSLLKTLGIIVLAAVMVFAMAGCKSGGGGDDDPNDPSSPNYQGGPNNPNSGNPNGTDEPPPPPPPVDAQAPNIVEHPESAVYPGIYSEVEPIWVTATSPDGGTLTYQWYKADGNSNATGVPIADATEFRYTPEGGVKSLSYYFCEITNTIADNGDGGTKTISVKSNPAYIGIAITPIKITGVTGKDKVYDTTDAAELNGSPTLAPVSGSVPVTGVSLIPGTVKFAQADAGTAIEIILTGWYISGANRDDYLLILYNPSGLTANITKAPGATISEVTVNGAATNNSITVNEITLTTGQSVKYAISKAANGTGLSTWQDSSTFTGLSAVTSYYVYAYSVGNNNYNDGENKVSSVITTANPKVYFETYGGTAMEAKTVTKGQMLLKSQTPDPDKEGYLFDWWFTDAAFTTPFDFQNATQNLINDNTTLHARWVDNATITMMRNSRDMEWIRTGEALLGETVDTRVFLVGYWMAKHEVTQEQWTEIMLANPSTFKSPVQGESGTPGKLPVETINFYDAIVYCNKLSIQEGLDPAYTLKNSVYPANWGTIPTGDYQIKVNVWGRLFEYQVQPNPASWDAVQIVPGSNGYRLPTPEQWEKACRAGTTTAFSNGSTVSGDTGWYSVNSDGKTHRVGQRPGSSGNAYGLFDMHGNVAEWVWTGPFNAIKLPCIMDGSTLASPPEKVLLDKYFGAVRGGGWSLDDSFMASHKSLSYIITSTQGPYSVDRETSQYPMGSSGYRYNFSMSAERTSRENYFGLRLVRP